MTIRTAAAALALLASAWATQAGAVITFSYTSSSPSPVETFSFSLPDDFQPASSDAQGFTTGDVLVNSTIFGPVTYSDDFTFYSAASGGGFGGGFNSYFGPVLFTGGTAEPRFANGSYALNDGTFDGTLVISGAADQPGAAVPEPAAWATMLAGLALAGAALRRQRARVAFG